MPAGENAYGLLRKEQEEAGELSLSMAFFVDHWRQILVVAMLVWFLAVSARNTALFAAMCGNDPSVLGQPFARAFGRVFYGPWQIYRWGEALKGASGPLVDLVNWNYAMAVGLPSLVFVAGIYLGGRAVSGIKGRADMHGSARWATMRDIKRYGYLNGEGVYIGGVYDEEHKKQHFLRHNGPEHILCFAPTRSGKGVGLIIPSLLVWEHSSVVLDIKGENYNFTAGYQKSQGHKVLRFNPADITGASAAFNPLAEIELDKISCIQEIQRIAVMVMDPEGKGLDDYWSKAANGFFAGAMLHCLIKTKFFEDRIASLYDVSVMLADPSRPVAEVFDEMLAMDHGTMLGEMFRKTLKPREEEVDVLVPDPDPKNQGKFVPVPIAGADPPRNKTRIALRSAVGDAARTFIAAAAREMKSKGKEELGGVVNSALSNLSLYRDPVVAMNMSRSDFKLKDLMGHEDPVNLYLVVSPNDLDRLRPLLRIIIAQMISAFTKKMEFDKKAAKKKHRLLLMLDEFTSLGKMPSIETGIAFVAGYGIKMYIIVQNIEQLDKIYADKGGKGGGVTFLANCHIRNAYAPNTAEGGKLLSEMAGTTTVVDHKRSMQLAAGKGTDSNTYSVNEVSRPLITPGECMTLPSMEDGSDGQKIPGDMLIFTAGKHPIYGRQILYFQHPELLKRSQVKAPEVSDSLYYQLPVAMGQKAVPLAVEEEQETPKESEATKPAGEAATKEPFKPEAIAKEIVAEDKARQEKGE